MRGSVPDPCNNDALLEEIGGYFDALLAKIENALAGLPVDDPSDEARERLHRARQHAIKGAVLARRGIGLREEGPDAA